MANILKLMKQAGEMRRKVAEAQAELASREVRFSSGGGAVEVCAGGDGMVRSVKIQAEAVKGGEVELLEDLVLAAVVGAQEAAKAAAGEVMGRVTAGMGLPPGLG